MSSDYNVRIVDWPTSLLDSTVQETGQFKLLAHYDFPQKWETTINFVFFA